MNALEENRTVQIVGGPRCGEELSIPASLLDQPVPFEEKLSFTPSLDHKEGDPTPARLFTITPTVAKLPCGNTHHVLRWPRLDSKGATA